MEDQLLKKGDEIDKEKDVMSTNLKLVEAKNQEIHDKLLASEREEKLREQEN